MTYSKKLALILLFALLLKFITLGMYDVYDSTEARYAGIGMRALLKQDLLTPWFLPEIPFLGKPPLAFWATSLSFKLFGFHEFFARLPHFLAVVLAMLFGYIFVKRFRNKNEALLFCLILSTSSLFWILAGSVMTDAFLCLGITVTNLSFFYAINKIKPQKYWYLFGIGITISLLSKGIVGVILSGICCFLYTLIKNKWRQLLNIHFILGLILSLLIAFPWFYFMEKTHTGFLQYFIIGENFARFLSPNWKGDKYGFTHSYPPFMIVIFMICSSIQWACFLIYNLWKNYKVIDLKNDYTFFIFLMCVVPLLFFSFARNIIFPYTAPAIIGFSMIVALFSVRLKIIYYFTIPFVIFYFLILSVFIQFFTETDKPLIVAFQELKTQDDILYYKVKPKFSSYFYSQDELIYITEITKETPVKFVISKKQDPYFSNFIIIKCNKKNCLYKSS